jgi:hypothetical protein
MCRAVGGLYLTVVSLLCWWWAVSQHATEWCEWAELGETSDERRATRRGRAERRVAQLFEREGVKSAYILLGYISVDHSSAAIEQ